MKKVMKMQKHHHHSRVLLPTIGGGLACAALAAWLATGMAVELLRKCFGGFLVLVGVTELFGKDQEK